MCSCCVTNQKPDTTCSTDPWTCLNSSGGWWVVPRLLMEGNRPSRTAAQISWSWRYRPHTSLWVWRNKRTSVFAKHIRGNVFKQKKSQREFPTPEDEAVHRIPLERASPQQEASSTGPDTGREPNLSVNQLHHHQHRSHASPLQLQPTMLRCRALLKSICSTSSSSLRRTSCGLKSRPWTGCTEPHSHRNSKTERTATSCWARWSSASRLFAPDGRQKTEPLLLSLSVFNLVIENISHHPLILMDWEQQNLNFTADVLGAFKCYSGCEVNILKLCGVLSPTFGQY